MSRNKGSRKEPFLDPMAGEGTTLRPSIGLCVLKNRRENYC